jgi:transcriptional antiterminator RfaH
VRSQPRHEHIAAAHLRRHEQLEVFSPRLRFKRATRRGPVWVTEPLFPSYLFAKFDWRMWLREVEHTPGVAAVVHFGLVWPTVPEEVIAELKSRVDATETRVIDEVYHEGDEVEVKGGLLDGWHAVVTRVMPARRRVAVLLDFLGRQTLVELDKSMLRKREAWCSVRVDCLQPLKRAAL